MRGVKAGVVLGWLLAGWAGAVWAQSNITLQADADASIREHTPSASNAGGILEVRSRNVEGSGRQNVAYIRFDLRVLATGPETGAVFSVTREIYSGSGTTFSNGEVRVYGLLDTFGNTPQGWGSGLTYENSGLEIPGDGDSTTQDLDTGRLQYLGDLPDSLSAELAETGSLSSPALDSFLADRVAADGLATLLLVSAADIDKELYFTNLESATNPGPTLDVVGTLGGGGDTLPPTVSRIAPVNGATNVELRVDVQATFSEPMDPATVTTNTFTLVEDATGSNVLATVSYDAGTVSARLRPEEPLRSLADYTARVVGGAGGVTDEAGNPLAADYVWSFTTADVPPPGPDDPIILIPDADARLANDENRGPASNVGGSSVWEVRWHEAPRVRIGYLRYDISGVDPSRFPTATISGTFTDDGRNGPADGSGMWNVYGLNDDVVADGQGRLGNDWPESDVNYANAAGVQNDAALGTFEILESETTLLGTISFDGVDEQPLPFSSNTTDLNLAAFLAADTDGLVTFLFMDVAQNGDEYRINSKEGSTADGHGPTTLNFIPGTAVGGLRFTGMEADAGGDIVVSWQARANHLYGVERTTESLVASNWVAVATNLLGAAVNTYTDAAPAAVSAVYRVRDEGEAPPVDYFLEDFESGAAGWTVLTGATHQAGTDWELGTPTSGPGSAQDGANVYATNLGGDFAPNADISLLSPVVDLTTAPTAALSFGNYYDFDGLSDFGYVYVRDEAGAEIAELTDPIATYSNYVIVWTTANVNLPAAALGRTVRFEFRFVSDGSVQYPGWYIDNVRVGD